MPQDNQISNPASAAQPALDKQAGQLVRNLETGGYHPILIMGPSSSGKTLLIRSLLSYLKSSPDSPINLTPGTGLIPPRYADADSRNEEGVSFLDNSVGEHQRGTIARRTDKTDPFFIPLRVEFKPDASSEPVRVNLAFLEGEGEWYQFEVGGGTAGDESDRMDTRKRKAFKSEIEEILKRYRDKGISIIYCVPSISEKTTETARKPIQELFGDMAMAAVIEQVTTLRGSMENDYELFCLTQWDNHFDNKQLVNMSGVDLNRKFVDELQSNSGDYGNSWGTLRNRFAGQRSSRYSLCAMPHASCRVEEGAIKRVDRNAVAFFDFFARTLGNWIIGNATESLNGQRIHVFPDVDILGRKRTNLLETSVRVLSGTF